MDITQVTENSFRFSVNAAPNSLLFESMWPIPEGVSMNSYIIKGEKSAIIDGVCGWDGVPESLFEQLDKANISLDSITVVVINHMEPDHSGWIANFAKIQPNFTIYTHAKSKILLERFFGITQPIVAVKSGDTLDLGNGHVLAFAEIPNVHWPETIATFDTKTQTLYPCDAFGSFKSIPEAPYDDQMSEQEVDSFEQETLRYFSNIVGAFSVPVKKALDKVRTLPVKIIAPGHGLVWRKNWKKIFNHYERFVSYAQGPAKKAVTVIWGSMYGKTGEAVPAAIQTLKEEGIEVYEHKVPESHVSYIIRDVWQSSGVIIAAPTYEYKLFPPMVAVLDELGKKKAQNRKAFHFGSYGWKPGSQEEIEEIASRLKMNWEFSSPVLFIAAPTPEDIQKVKDGSRDLARRVKNWVG